MKTIQINVYSLDELQPKAKERALEKHRLFNVDDDCWYDWVFDDFVAFCETVGITIVKGSIHFSGFWSQGDGSTFGAKVDILQFLKGVETQAWKSYAPNVELSITPFKLDSRIKVLIENGVIDGNCSVHNPLRGYWTNVDTSFNYSYNQCKDYNCIDKHLNLIEEWLDEAIETLNRHLYKSLEEEYEYQVTDEAVAETITINDYHFTIDGEKADRLLALEGIAEQ